MNGETTDYLIRLSRRYRRLFWFDLILHATYALTAVIPLWAIIQHRTECLFHTSAVTMIAAVGILGIYTNLRLLRNHEWGFWLGLLTTGLFLGSRFALLWWGLSVFTRQFDPIGVSMKVWDILPGIIDVGGSKWRHKAGKALDRRWLEDQ